MKVFHRINAQYSPVMYGYDQLKMKCKKKTLKGEPLEVIVVGTHNGVSSEYPVLFLRELLRP